MMRLHNPFRASMGSTPPYLAGRHHEIHDFSEALQDGPGTHERISLVTGLRGVGKTVLLNAFEDEARSQSWWVISETATAGFPKRILDTLYSLPNQTLKTHEKRLSGLTFPSIGGVQFSDLELHKPEITLRAALTNFLHWQQKVDDTLKQDPTGLLITLDELHHYRRNEVIEFGTTIQHLVRENLNIAVAMAGIPQAIKPLLASDAGTNPVTFLRRANRIDLGLISDADTRKALEQPVVNVGFEWDDEALDAAVEACGGYPFMVQLIGHQSFKRREGDRLTLRSVTKAAVEARRKLGQLVHEPSLSDLSAVDRTFLAAMAVDDGPSTMAAIADRMQVDAQYAGTYRRRLIDAEIITSVRHGVVDFELPYMREYLNTHAIVDAMKSEKWSNNKDSKE